LLASRVTHTFPAMAMTGSAVLDLGLGGLQDQVATESEEERKKRMAEMQQQKLLGPSGSLAVTNLFAPRGGTSVGY
jgi:hypothetical protein